MESIQLEAGDLITHGTFLYYADELKTVWITREGDQMWATTEWRIDPLIEANKAEANSFSRSSGLGDLQKVASVPMGVYQKWDKDGIVEDKQAFARRLNNADYAAFRTNNLKV